MSPKKRKFVRIKNAASGKEYTSLKAAKRAVDRGIAYFDQDGSLVFLTNDHRSVSVYRTVSEIGYDRASVSGIASVDAVKNLPVVGNVLVLMCNRSRAGATAR